MTRRDRQLPNRPQAGPQNRAVLIQVWEGLSADAQGLSRFKAVVGVLVTSAGAYVLGGIVVALRLNQAQFPVQDSLGAIPPFVLLLTGVRELVLSAIVAVVLFGLMLAVSTPRRIPDLAALVLPVVLLAFVPLNVGGLAWPAGLLILGALFWWIKSHLRHEKTWVPPTTRIAFVCVTVVLLVTLARYTVPPYKFPVAHLEVRRADESDRFFRTSGGYISATSDFIYLAGSDRSDDRDNAYLAAYPRDQVLYMELTAPPEGKSPPSIVGLLTDSGFACTPFLDIWLHDEYHGLRLFR